MKIISPVSLLLASSAVGGLGSELRGAMDMQDSAGEREALVDLGGEGDGTPAFLSDDEVPLGLIKDPSREVGVDFQRGSKPRAQPSPNLFDKKRSSMILGLDNKIIDLDTDDAERINIYNPEQYKVSRDGTYVTHKETGDRIPLTVFYRKDKMNDKSIMFSTDSFGNLINVRVAPNKRERGISAQNFQRLDDSDILVGYLDEDIDLSDLPPYGEPLSRGEKPIPGDLPITKKKQHQGNRRRRHAQASSFPMTHFGKTCEKFDYLDVAITTDKAFMREYPDHKAHAQAIFAVAHEIYWLESCVYLYMWQYENTVEDSWPWWEEQPEYTRISGCSADLGAIDLFGSEVSINKADVYRDAWHMFTGIKFRDGGVVGCAWRGEDVCGDDLYGNGVESMIFTTSLRLQGVVFAHELGHNLNQRHLSTTQGFYVMEKIPNYAPLGFRGDVAAAIKDHVLGSKICGWFDDPNFV